MIQVKQQTPIDIAPETDCVASLKVLAEPTRLRVMRLLLRGALHAGEIQERLAMEQTLLSHHLRVLREAGLVRSERDGKAVLYRVAPGVSLPSSGEALDLGCCVLAFDSGDRG